MRGFAIAAVVVALLAGCKAEDVAVGQMADVVEWYCQRVERIEREFGSEVMERKRAEWRAAIREQTGRTLELDCE